MGSKKGAGDWGSQRGAGPGLWSLGPPSCSARPLLRVWRFLSLDLGSPCLAQPVLLLPLVLGVALWADFSLLFGTHFLSPDPGAPG